MRALPRRKSSLALSCLAAAAMLLPAERLHAQPAPSAPTAWLTDRAGLLTAATRSQLDARLQQLERRTGHQFLVYVDRTTAGEPLERWTARAFGAWRLGRRGLDDGLALFLFVDDRRLRIEVGYGLEAVVTDAQSARILRDVATPLLRAGDPDGAVRGTVDALAVLLGDGSAGKVPVPPPRLPRPLELLLGLLAAVGFVLLLVRYPWLGWFLLARGGQGGGGLSGGGPSGGGGRSGGGGASGSW